MTFDPTQAAEPRTVRRGSFWVGAELEATPSGSVVTGAMYVEWEAPVDVRRPHPLVLVHGGGGQGLDWLQTVDGRPGWAAHLVDAGYLVLVVDRPGHGRSPFPPEGLGPMSPPIPYEAGRGLFAGVGVDGHDQWPGDGSTGDAALLQLLAGAGPMRVDVEAAQRLEQERLAALLDHVGPAVVVGHSLGGPAAWLAADARPDLVRAVVAIEPFGPPFVADPQLGVELVWGPTTAPVTWDPAPGDPAELRDATPRRLAHLSRVPIAYVSAEASAFRGFDSDYVAFLEGAGCDVDLVRLDEHGVRGNGHALMHERNSREALRPILDWLDRLERGERPTREARSAATS